MSLKTPLCDRLGIDLPIIQAPMAGGSDGPALAAAVSEAGGLGFLGATYLTPDGVEETAAHVRASTNRAFGINLFAPQPVLDVVDGAAEKAVEAAAPFFQEVGAAGPLVPNGVADPFDKTFPKALESGANVFSFIMGLLPEEAMTALKARDIAVIGTATTVGEATALAASGVDAIIAQGSEAGGHRGWFTNAPDGGGLIGTMALVPQIVDAVDVPVIAAGGIADGRGLAAALMLGAEAVQMGTAFLTTHEASAPDIHKRAILDAKAEDIRLTRAFSGRPAQGIKNRFMEAFGVPYHEGDRVLPFPHQNAMTRPMRTAATKASQGDYMSLWAGQALGLNRQWTAHELIETVVNDAQAALGRFA